MRIVFHLQMLRQIILRIIEIIFLSLSLFEMNKLGAKIGVKNIFVDF